MPTDDDGSQGTPGALQAVVDRTLAKNPAARFASATALLTSLPDIDFTSLDPKMTVSRQHARN